MRSFPRARSWPTDWSRRPDERISARIPMFPTRNSTSRVITASTTRWSPSRILTTSRKSCRPCWRLVRAHDIVVVPSLQHGRHVFLDVVKILLGLQRVVDAVITLLVEFLVGNIGIRAEMRSSGRLDQSVGHE